MEASNGGELVRKYHPNLTPNIRIPCIEGSKFRIQRGLQRSDGYQPIRCASEYVSKFHCVIFRRDKAYWIRDLKSTNGTFLNGNKLTANTERELRFGDTFGVGVSHEEADSNIDTKDPKYFIFLFQKEEVKELEVIDLEDEDDDASTAKPSEETTADVSSRPQADSDEEDIKFVGEYESPPKENKNACPSSTSKKRLPPAPPPPIISKSLESDSSHAKPELTSTSKCSGGQITATSSSALQQNAIPESSLKHLSSSHTHSANESVATAKCPPNETQHEPRNGSVWKSKGAKGYTRTSSVSTDDSSDGLDDSLTHKTDTERRSKLQSAHKMEIPRNNPKLINNSYSSRNNKSNYAEQDRRSKIQDLKPDVALNGKVKVPTGILQDTETKLSKREIKTPIYKDTAVSIPQTICKPADVKVDVKPTNSYSEIMKFASPTNPTVSVSQAIVFAQGKFTLNKDMFDATNPESKKRMKEQFLASLRDHKPHLLAVQNDRKRPIASTSSADPSSDSDSSDGFKNKRKRLQHRAENEDSRSDQTDKEDRINCNDKTEQNLLRTSENNNDEREALRSLSGAGLASEINPKRTIKILDFAPPPRSAVRAQNKAAAFKQPVHRGGNFSKMNSGSPTYEQDHRFMSRDEQKQARSLKLKEVELKRKMSEGEMTATPSPKKSQPAAKVKFTERNRNQELMESMLDPGGNNESPSRANYPKTGESDRLKPSIIPPADPSSVKEVKPSTSNGFLLPSAPGSSDFRYEKNSAGDIPGFNESSKDSHSTAQLKMQFNSTPTVLKPGAAVIKSPSAAVAPIAYKEKPNTLSKTHLATPATLEWQTLIAEDDIYKRLLLWRPAWLEEQKKVKEPPPITPNLPVSSTLVDYEQYQHYFSVYYPLLLCEIWGVITSDVDKRRGEGSKAKASVPRRKRAEFDIAICGIKRPHYSSFARPKTKKTSDAKIHSDELWCHITYQCWLKNETDIETKKDFVILTIHGREKGSQEITRKQIFGLILFNTGRFDHDSHESIKPHILRSKRIPGGVLYSETIECRLAKNFIVDTNQLGHVDRICYISAKLREFRALNGLQSSKLFRHIISPPEMDKIWTQEKVDEHNMISLTRLLNQDQQQMINYVTNRVFSDDPELMLMHGPPGTGKTRTIVALVLQLLVTNRRKRPSSNSRILICTPSNAAVDEIMRRLKNAIDRLPQTGKKIDMVRVGEGYAPEFSVYAVNNRVRQKEEERSTTNSLKAELESLRLEMEEKQKSIEVKKKVPNYCPIEVEAQLSDLRELGKKKESLRNDLKNLQNRKLSIGEDSRHGVVRDAQIICSTLSASCNSLMKNIFGRFLTKEENPFLCCIVDEASQTTEPETLLPLALEIDKLLLVGDPHQLGATVLSTEAEKKDFGQSLFTRLFKHYNRNKTNSRKNPVMTLKRQYRMHHEIVKWPNIFFYGKELITDYKPLSNYPLRPYYFLNLAASREHSEKEGQIQNVAEVEMVKAIMEALEEMLSKLGVKLTVGIITPYSAQRQGIKQALLNKTSSTFLNIEVDTVDGFQGQEKDIIILSCVRTETTGFLKSRNRLNVALTRAKHSLYIIGDVRCLSQDDMWKCLIQDAARRDCKYDVNPDFRSDLRLLKSQLCAKLRDLPPQRPQQLS